MWIFLVSILVSAILVAILLLWGASKLGLIPDGPALVASLMPAEIRGALTSQIVLQQLKAVPGVLQVPAVVTGVTRRGRSFRIRFLAENGREYDSEPLPMKASDNAESMIGDPVVVWVHPDDPERFAIDLMAMEKLRREH